MAFGDRLKKAFGFGKKDKKESESEDNSVVDESVKIIEEAKIDKSHKKVKIDKSHKEQDVLKDVKDIKNFKYLDELIHSGLKEIVLDSDIILDDDEESQYKNGINIDVDDLVIDGDFYFIDAKSKARIFNLSSKLTLKNITLKNGFAIDGGAIYTEQGSVLNFSNSLFKDNSAKENGGAIFNTGLINLYNCNFINNSTDIGDGGAIYNKEYGSCLTTSCQFRENISNNKAGAIYNLGKTELMKCKFISNTSKDGENIIYSNVEDDLKVDGCEFRQNISIEKGKQQGLAETNENGRKDSDKSESSLKTCENCGHEISKVANKCPYCGSGKKEETFKYLDELIHEGLKEIVLDTDITLGDGEESQYSQGIKLDIDALVIDGNGHAIDAYGKTRIFYCTAKNITIKNIILKNGYAEKNGGAIYNADGSLTVKDSSFTGNTVNWYGGAIHNTDGSLTVKDSSFTGNAANRGGAIYNADGSLNVKNSSFTGNTANLGGAIHNIDGELNMECTTLNENMSNHGGAIHNENASLKITESTFCKNKSELWGGAIHNYKGDSDIIKSSFSKNTAYDDGGAIHNREGNFSIMESDFSENSAKNDGGAICNNEGELNIKESAFNKSMSKNGGAICNASGNFKIFNCRFTSNNSPNNIILNNDYLEMDNINLYDNQSKYIVFNDNNLSNLSIIGSKFVKNNIDEAMIFNNGKSCTIYKTVFEDYLYESNLKNIINHTNLTLITPKINDDGKTILNEGHIFIKKSSKSIESKICGGGIVETDRIPIEEKFDFGYLDKKIHEITTNEFILEEDISFENYEIDFYEGGIDLDIDNLIFDGNGKTIDGSNKSRIFVITGKNITLKNIKFKNGYSHKNPNNSFNNNGGAIKVNHDVNLTIINCEFINNASEESGGAIHNRDTELNIVESTLNDNTTLEYGGAIHNEGFLNISKSTIKDNTAKCGGAINNAGSLRIIESTLYTNTSELHGGAIRNNKSDLDIIKSSIAKNFANEEGGAIINDNGKLSVKESEFNENKSNRGGAITNESGELNIAGTTINRNVVNDSGGAILNNDGKLIITESTFTGNIAKGESGGAILNYKGNMNIVKSSFDENTAIHDGGGIFNDVGNLSVIESSFNKNKVDNGSGGAIYNTKGNLNIVESSLNNNVCQAWGGAIDNFEGKLTIKHSIFDKNMSWGDGGAINNSGGNLFISFSKLNKNLAKQWGGAILNSGELSVVSSIFKQNTVNGSLCAGGAIYNLMDGNYNLENCNFENNNPNDVN